MAGFGDLLDFQNRQITACVRKEDGSMNKTYTRTTEEVLHELGVTAEGLTTQQAQKRLEQYGPNKLKDAEKPTLLQRFLSQLKDPMLIILMIAAAVSAVTNIISGESLAEVFIILIVVLLNAILGVFQESKAEAAIERRR